MQWYLIDTWFLIARLNPEDAHHRRARQLWQRQSHTAFITHDGVLAEFLTFFAGYGPFWRTRAAAVVRGLALEGVTVVPQDRSLFLRSIERYEERPDKEYSLVDCMSMVLMEERGIRHVLTNDHHFTQAGFLVVNE